MNAPTSTNNNNTSGTTTTNKSDGEQDAVKSDISPEGTDEDTRAGALTSKAFSNNVNNASQYHNDNSEVEESDQNDSEDVISNQSDNQHFSSSKSSIDVSFLGSLNFFKLNLNKCSGRRYRRSKAEGSKGGCKETNGRTKE